MLTLPLYVVKMTFGVLGFPLILGHSTASGATNPPCRITISPVATLGSDSDPVSPTDFQLTVARDRLGRFYVAPTAEPWSIAVYDAGGRFSKLIGRRGEGPGEYQFIMRVLTLPGDSMLVIDVGNGRITLLSPDHQPVRTIRMPGYITDVVPLRDGTMIAHGRVATAEGIGFPLHLLSRDGSVIRSFGSVRPEARRDRPQAGIRKIAAANAGEVWSRHMDRYEIDLYSVDGVLLRSIRRDVEWYRPYDYRPGTPRTPPMPVAVGIWQDGPGRLWTMSRIPSDSWRVDRRYPGQPERPIPPFDKYAHEFETVLEVFDAATGNLLASERVPQFMMGSVGGGMVYSLRATNDGDLRVDVWEVAVSACGGSADAGLSAGQDGYGTR